MALLSILVMFLMNSIVTPSMIKNCRRINVPELISNPNDPTEQECKDLIDAIRCKKCKRKMVSKQFRAYYLVNVTPGCGADVSVYQKCSQLEDMV